MNILNAKIKILSVMEPIFLEKDRLSGAVKKVAQENGLSFEALWPWTLNEALTPSNSIRARSKRPEKPPVVIEKKTKTVEPSEKLAKQEVDVLQEVKKGLPTVPKKDSVKTAKTAKTAKTTIPKSRTLKPTEIRRLEKKIEVKGNPWGLENPLPSIPNVTLTEEDYALHKEMNNIVLDETQDWVTRIEAVENIICPHIALDTYLATNDKWIKVALTLVSKDNRNDGLIHLSRKDRDRDLRIAGYKATWDQVSIVWAAREDRDRKVRRTAVKKILNQAVREELYASEVDKNIKLIIIGMSTNKEWLNEFNTNTKATIYTIKAHSRLTYLRAIGAP